MNGPEGIAKFWDWWSENEQRLRESLDQPEGRGTATDEIRFRLKKLKLEGDVIPVPGGYVIIGSPGELSEQRLIAAHWQAAAPASEHFGFLTYRPAQNVDQLIAVTLPGDPPVPLADLRFTAEWNPTDDRADVTAYVHDGVHPIAARLIALRVLRSSLGELEADCWIHEVVAVDVPPAGALDLRALVADLTTEITARSEVRWTTTDFHQPTGQPLTVLLRHPIQPERHPFLNTCVAVRLQLQALDEDEPHRLHGQLLDGIPGDVLLVGGLVHDETFTTLIYANGQSPTIPLLRERASLLGGELHTSHDPAWLAIRRFQRTDPTKRHEPHDPAHPGLG